MSIENRSIGLSDEEMQPTQKQQGRAYIFAIGIDKYQHVNPLNNAVRDVEKVVDLLTAKYQFEPDCVTKLLNKAAKRSAIHREFRRLRERVTADDSLLIYFSGHGIEDHNDGYWIPVEGVPDDTASFVSNIEIINFLKQINSLHTLVISDSCFSGTLFLDPERRVSVRQRLETIPSRWAMTSGRKEPVSDGASGKNSPFADSLLLHLSHNAENALPVSHLFQTVIEDVGSNYQQLPRCEPLRNVSHRGGEFMFRLKGVASAVSAAPTVATAITTPLPPWWRNYIWQIGLAGLAMLIAVFIFVLPYIFSTGKTGEIEVPKTTLAATPSQFLLGDLDSGTVKNFDFFLTNTGTAIAYLDTVYSDCGAVRILNFRPDSFGIGQKRRLNAEWRADKTGSQQCLISVYGRNLAQPIQIAVQARVVRKVLINPAEPASANQAPQTETRRIDRNSNISEEIAQPPPPDRPESASSIQYIDINAHVPTDVIMYIKTGNAGAEYTAVARNGIMVFTVPKTLFGSTVEVIFERNGKRDKRNIRLGRDEIILPASLKN